jgi:hypothetical protein
MTRTFNSPNLQLRASYTPNLLTHLLTAHHPTPPHLTSSQLDTYLNEEYPCTREAALFCSDHLSASRPSSPEHTLLCLQAVAAASPEEVSLECTAVLDGFSACKGGAPRDNGKPGPKPKPRARTRLLTATAAASSSSSSSSLSVTSREGGKDNPSPSLSPLLGRKGGRRGRGSAGRGEEEGAGRARRRGAASWEREEEGCSAPSISPGSSSSRRRRRRGRTLQVRVCAVLWCAVCCVE